METEIHIEHKLLKLTLVVTKLKKKFNNSKFAQRTVGLTFESFKIILEYFSGI